MARIGRTSESPSVSAMQSSIFPNIDDHTLLITTHWRRNALVGWIPASLRVEWPTELVDRPLWL